MEIQYVRPEGLLVIKPRIFNDSRGYFFESYRQDMLLEHGFTGSFVQDNESLSQKDVLRGLHFQDPPYAQAKLVRVISGEIMDMAIDIRKSSETYGQHFSIVLNAENKYMLLIPEGFAHGFITLKNETIVNYKCSNTYNKASERTLLWNDPDLAIDWITDAPIISDKDLHGIPFKLLKSSF